jgi:sporulation protein YlmC with PRC-barrel domain
MQLSDLLGLRVLDAGNHRLGTVIDVRLSIDGSTAAGTIDDPSPPRLAGLVVSPHTRSSYLGYDRTDIHGPALIAAIAHWRHRGTFVVVWEDIARVGSDHVTLRSGYVRRSPALRSNGR